MIDLEWICFKAVIMHAAKNSKSENKIFGHF